MATIVTTLRIGCDSVESIYSFIAYHLSIGFKHLYCFLDHPDNNNLHELISNKFGTASVTVFMRSSELNLAQKRFCLKYVDLEEYLLTEVPARQTINAEYAYHMATNDGYRWLLHIDIDELFYINGSGTRTNGETGCVNQVFDVNSHFDLLDAIGAQSMTYVNHEGVPETFDSPDFCSSTTLFRRHHFALPVNPTTSKAIDFWKNRTTYQQYFLVYDNGKSAVRLGLQGAVSKNVHQWQLSEQDSSAADSGNDTRYRTALMDPRTLQVKRLLRIDQPCILHFVTCGFRWLLDKYSILGRFPNFWFGDRLPIAPSFHLNARDVVLGTQLDVSSEESEESKHNTNIVNTAKFFVQQILLNCQSVSDATTEINSTLSTHIKSVDTSGVDLAQRTSDVTRSLVDHSEERDGQLESGVLMRLTRVQQILQAIQHYDISLSFQPAGGEYVEHIRHLASQVPVEDMNGFKRERTKGEANTTANTVHTFNHDDNISELDKLRIISQVAYNFL